MFIPNPGSEFSPSRIRDTHFFHLGSRICIKEFKYFNPKKWFLSSRKYDPGCSSRIRIPDTDFYPSRTPDRWFKKAPEPGSGSATLTERKHREKGTFKAHEKTSKMHMQTEQHKAQRDGVTRGGGVSWPGTTTWELFMGNCASVFVARNTTSDRVEAKMYIFAKMASESVRKGIFYKGKNSIQHFFKIGILPWILILWCKFFNFT